MKRTLYWLLCAGGVLLSVCCLGCGQEEKTGNIKTQENAAQVNEIAENEADNAATEESEESEDRKKEETQKTMEYPDIRRIVCWGDSLTFGEGGEGVTFPDVLQEEFGIETLNYGVQGETAKQIALRMGALKMHTGAFTIPKDTVPTEVTLWYEGEDPIMMRMSDAGINPCTIAGVEGTLSYREEDGKYYFIRTMAGEECVVEDQTEVETFAAKDKRDTDLIVLFAGTNRAPDRNTVGELTDLEESMIEYLGTEYYVVIGLTCKAMAPDVEWINEHIQKVFGDHYLNLRGYLMEEALEDANITPTEKDMEDIADGEVPSSLRVDIVHGTPVFYQLTGEWLAEQLREKHYLP